MRTLLVADESVTIQRVIALTFAEQDIRVVSAGDGQQAMEKMASDRPDIVLAGTSLPNLSGYDLAKYIRGNTDLRDVRVLLMSGAFETVDDARFTSSGADGIIEKPVEPATVIGRVKELLGLKSTPKPASAGRLVTSPDGAADRKVPAAPAPPSVVTTHVAPPTVEASTTPTSAPATPAAPIEESSGQAPDYLGSLDAAFDSLDKQLSGRDATTKAHTPTGPLRHAGADPRSPGRAPNLDIAPGAPVFEVDDDWFGADNTQALADARAGRRELAEDLRDPGLLPPSSEASANPVFEVDDGWFAEDDKARAAKRREEQDLAAEMGIHDVDLPEKVPALTVAPAADLDFDFGLDSLPAVAPPPPSAVVEDSKPVETAAADVAPSSDTGVDFAALLAIEQGAPPPAAAPPPAPAPEIRLVTPEVTEEMLEQIAARVTDRLTVSAFGDQLRDTMAATVRDTVRAIVSETSERLVREEIERIKSTPRT